MADPVPVPVPDPDKQPWNLQAALQTLLGLATVVMLLLQGCGKSPTPQPGPLPPNPDNVVKDVELPPVVKGPIATFIDITGKTLGDKLEWYIDPRLTWRPVDPGSQKTMSVVAKERGTYLVLAWTSLQGKPTAYASTNVVVGDGEPPTPTPVPPGPGPQPPTPPGPGPAPSPVKKLFAVVIEDTAAAKSNRWAYYADPELIKHFRSKGYILRVEDKSVVDATGQTPKDLQSYLKAVQGIPLPAVILADQDGKELFKGPLPGTKGVDLLNQVKKVGG